MHIHTPKTMAISFPPPLRSIRISCLVASTCCLLSIPSRELTYPLLRTLLSRWIPQAGYVTVVPWKGFLHYKPLCKVWVQPLSGSSKSLKDDEQILIFCGKRLGGWIFFRDDGNIPENYPRKLTWHLSHGPGPQKVNDSLPSHQFSGAKMFVCFSEAGYKNKDRHGNTLAGNY